MLPFVVVSCLIFKVSLKRLNGNFNKNPRLLIQSLNLHPETHLRYTLQQLCFTHSSLGLSDLS